ncbi:hypothetical protein E2C01_026953 [Portunus trituberculatus]|uniref:Uncharacterized protein n=1 Tax=Portunus trituberculatus TaxID=210409 RepID=A0A5B7EJV0_PORTR|nr:hypothetical protein [Portunus trituberculatus]
MREVNKESAPPMNLISKLFIAATSENNLELGVFSALRWRETVSTGKERWRYSCPGCLQRLNFGNENTTCEGERGRKNVRKRQSLLPHVGLLVVLLMLPSRP